MIQQVTLRDSFKEYKKVVVDPLDEKTYSKVTGGLFEFMMDKVLDCSQDVELAGGQSLGTIGIRGTKNGKLKPDWKATYALWNSNPEAKANREKIYHLNDHTNGTTYHFYWWTEGMKIGFKKLYSFKFAKGNKRRLTKLAFDGHEWHLKLKREHIKRVKK